jgi:lysophospholipase L1-like esterase
VTLARRRALRTLVTILLTVMMLATLEAGARLLRRKSAPDDTPAWEYSADIGWQARPLSRTVAFGALREFDQDRLFTADSIDALPAEGRARRLVLLLGDSRTFGNGVATADTYGEVLQRRNPGLTVINRAFPGYSSLQGLISLRADAPRFRPDVLLFAFDFNDRRYVLYPSDVDSPDHFRRLTRLDAWDRLTSSLALVEFVRKRSLSGDHAAAHRVDLGTVRPRVSPSDFRENLRAVARYCADHGIELLLLILNDNVSDSRQLEQGTRARLAGRLHEAEPLLRAAIASHNVFSEAARLELGTLYEQMGRQDEAAHVRISPRTFYSVAGGYPIRSAPSYRAIVQEVGAETGVRVVDAGSEVDRVPTRYLDFCHFDADGHRVVADVVAAVLH